MKASATIFTWPPDYLAASYAARALSKLGVRVFLAIEKRHPLPHIEGCEAVHTDFPRNGNLNGKRCVEGILALLERHATPGDEWALKIDSDAVVRGFQWLDGRREEAVGLFHPPHRGFFGFCYALRVSALAGLRERATRLPDDPTLFEDVTIGELADPAFRYENLQPGCPFAAYPWETKKPVSYWQEKYEIMAFQRVSGVSRRQVAMTMRTFLS